MLRWKSRQGLICYFTKVFPPIVEMEMVVEPRFEIKFEDVYKNECNYRGSWLNLWSWTLLGDFVPQTERNEKRQQQKYDSITEVFRVDKLNLGPALSRFNLCVSLHFFFDCSTTRLPNIEKRWKTCGIHWVFHSQRIYIPTHGKAWAHVKRLQETYPNAFMYRKWRSLISLYSRNTSKSNSCRSKWFANFECFLYGKIEDAMPLYARDFSSPYILDDTIIRTLLEIVRSSTDWMLNWVFFSCADEFFHLLSSTHIEMLLLFGAQQTLEAAICLPK